MSSPETFTLFRQPLPFLILSLYLSRPSVVVVPGDNKVRYYVREYSGDGGPKSILRGSKKATQFVIQHSDSENEVREV
jgi:hypothetical protein